MLLILRHSTSVAEKRYLFTNYRLIIITIVYNNMDNKHLIICIDIHTGSALTNAFNEWVR